MGSLPFRLPWIHNLKRGGLVRLTLSQKCPKYWMVNEGIKNDGEQSKYAVVPSGFLGVRESSAVKHRLYPGHGVVPY